MLDSNIAHVDPSVPITPIVATRKLLPVILVPGIMGSRLTKDRALTWNPFGYPKGEDAGLFTMHSSLADMDTPHVPDQWNGFPPGSWEAAERGPFRHSYEIVWEAYKHLLLDLHVNLRIALGVVGWEPVFYCCGYDWRQSNRVAATLLGRRVTEATALAGGEKPVLICHSMGGLVARYFMRTGGEGRVRGCALLGSPTLGAPQAYGFLKCGVDATQFPHSATMAILGRAGRLPSRFFFRRMASTYELAPLSLFPRSNWLVYDFNHTGYALKSSVVPPPRTRPEVVNCTNAHALYNDPFTGFMDQPTDRAIVSVMLANRQHFVMNVTSPDGKKAYVHPNTFIASTSTLPTVTGGALDNLGVNHFQQLPNNDIVFGDWWNDTPGIGPPAGRIILSRMTEAVDGDKTVPTSSSSPIPQLLTSSPKYFDGGKEEHGNICNDFQVISNLRAWICSTI